MTTHSGLVIPMSGWNIIYGHRDPKQIYEDPEGLATIKNFARNAAWTMKAISLLKDQLPMPEKLVYSTKRLRLLTRSFKCTHNEEKSVSPKVVCWL